MTETRSDLTAQLAVLASTVLWGTLWIPVSRMHAADSSGAIATTIGFLIPLAVLLPTAVLTKRLSLAGLREAGLPGLWLALAIALYTEALARGPIAHAILLFYLMPVWSTLLARIVLGEAITQRRIATIVLGLTGMLVIFGAGSPFSRSVSTGDGIALAAGATWALALVSSRQRRSSSLFDRVLVQFLFLGPVFFLATLIPGAKAAGPLAQHLGANVLLWAFGFALIWMLPVVWLTIFGASRVEAGRFAVLLMCEIVVGLTTVALLGDETLGPRELCGAFLILAASGVEVAADRPFRRQRGEGTRGGR